MANDPAARVVLLRSAVPGWFIAHFDVEAILRIPTDAPATDELNPFDQMCETFRTMAKPTIAVIAGRVGGGGSELSLACDMRFAGPDAVFNQPEVALGIIPGGGGTVRLPRLMGRSRALEVVLGCDDHDAATAERYGWVNRVVDDVDPFVDRLAGRIASFPPRAVAAAKRSVLGAEGSLPASLAAESVAFNGLLGDDVTRTAMERFLARGGQTEEGERRLGDLAAEIAASTTED
jgi:enoyl-CoA hydratase/carnithine racemase